MFLDSSNYTDANYSSYLLKFSLFLDRHKLTNRRLVLERMALSINVSTVEDVTYKLLIFSMLLLEKNRYLTSLTGVG